MNSVTTAIILCAGRGTRMGPLTENCPKPLLTLSSGETLLEAKLNALPASINKVILVVGYLEEMIREKIGYTYKGKEVLYVTQDITRVYGTGAALNLCKEHIDTSSSFLVLMGDDIYAKEDLEQLCSHKNAVLLFRGGEAKMLASWQVRVEQNSVIEFYETVPEESKRTGIINAGAYTIDPTTYFSVEPLTGADGEVQIPPTVSLLVRQGVSFNAVFTTYWKQVTSPEDLTL